MFLGWFSWSEVNSATAGHYKTVQARVKVWGARLLELTGGVAVGLKFPSLDLQRFPLNAFWQQVGFQLVLLLLVTSWWVLGGNASYTQRGIRDMPKISWQLKWVPGVEKAVMTLGGTAAAFLGIQLQLCTCVPLTLDVVQTRQGGIKSTSMQTMFKHNRRNIVDPINSTYLAI